MNDLDRNPLDLPTVRKRVRKREAIKGPRKGDWVIMPDGSITRLTSYGIGEWSSWIDKDRPWPIDARPDPKNSNRIYHPCFGTDFRGRGSFHLNDDGTASHSGGNDFHNVSRRAKLLNTGQTKPGEFSAFKMFDPDLDSDERFLVTVVAL
jgi:hypothetical protein